MHLHPICKAITIISGLYHAVSDPCTLPKTEFGFSSRFLELHQDLNIQRAPASVTYASVNYGINGAFLFAPFFFSFTSPPSAHVLMGSFLAEITITLIISHHHCILNSTLVNQNELKRSSSGLRGLKISGSIC